MDTVLLGRRRHPQCDRRGRRDLLQAGVLGYFGLMLDDLLRLRAAAAAPAARADSVILLWCRGGPSHLDSFDPKPEAPVEIRGQFGAIETAAPGILLSEHLPETARAMRHVALVRSLTSGIAAHEQASQYLLTGYRPLPTLEYPSYGAVTARELGSRNKLPPYVAIAEQERGAGSGFFGAGYNPFTIPDPAAPGFRVRNVTPPAGVTASRLARRRELADRLSQRFVQTYPEDSVRSVDRFYEAAYDLVGSAAARRAFDVGEEPDTLRERYGRTTLGAGALLARRLVEAGVRFVTVSRGGWDTHQQNFPALARLLPELDRAYATLLTDLADRGALARTLVILMGEFGRTPRVNPRGGRDHWARCRFVAFAGAGVRGGQAIGASDAQGGAPRERAVSVEDLATTVYTALGIDPAKQYRTPTGRPIALAQGGSVIQELWS